ncbi:MAG: sugar ABC transporter permease [Bacillota bacterium]
MEDTKKMKKRLLSKNAGEKLFWLVLIAPALIIVTLFILIPLADSVLKSFTDYTTKNIVRGITPEWNNFENYLTLLERGVLGNAVKNTFIFVVAVVGVAFILGFTLALVLNSNIKFARTLRSVMMIPWVVPTVISALVWTWIYQPQYGLLKYVVRIFSGGEIDSFGMLLNTDTALLGIIIAAVWKQIPLMALLLLAGLQNVPKDIMEAATVDGASGFKRLTHITMPYMSSVIKVAVSMSIIENFKQFPLFWQMTKGGPDGSTTTLAVLSYQEAFLNGDYGSGSAVTTIWMILMIGVVLFYNKIFKPVDVT